MLRDNVVSLFRRPPKIETQRLLLRRMKQSDYYDMYDYARRSDVTRYLTWEPHTDLEYTRRYLSYVESCYKAGTFFDWALQYKGDGHMIGTCGFTSFNYDARSAEIGYVINPRYQCAGIATEAACRVISFGFESLDLHRIEAHYMAGNDASRRVMEKVGMQFEGIHRESMFVKGVYVSVGVCAMTVDDYASIISIYR